MRQPASAQETMAALKTGPSTLGVCPRLETQAAVDRRHGAVRFADIGADGDGDEAVELVEALKALLGKSRRAEQCRKNEQQAGNQAIVVHHGHPFACGPWAHSHEKQQGTCQPALFGGVGERGEADRLALRRAAVGLGQAGNADAIGRDTGRNQRSRDRAEACGRQVPRVETVFTLRQAQRLDADNGFPMREVACCCQKPAVARL